MAQIFNETYFRTVFHKNFDRIYAGFYKKTGSEAVAQDLAQLAFIKLWEYRSSYSFDLPLELQLNRKAKLVYIDWLRKEAHQRKLAKELQLYNVSRIEPQKFELTNTLQAAISKLPPMRKKVFTLAYIDGFSHKEIAESMDLSVKTVDNHILKALQQLRKILALLAVLSVIS